VTDQPPRLDAVNVKCMCCGKMIPRNPFERTIRGRTMLFCGEECYEFYLEYRLREPSHAACRHISHSYPHMRIESIFFLNGRLESVADAVKNLDSVVELRELTSGKVWVKIVSSSLPSERAIVKEVEARTGLTVERFTTQFFTT
jgi:hypothetical protein